MSFSTTPVTTDVVSTFVDAWGYMTGQYPGHLHSSDAALAVTLSQTNCSFLNIISVDQPVSDAAVLETVLAKAAQARAQCPQDALLLVCPEWLPAGAADILAANDLSFFMKMWGMSADRLLPPRRPAPALDFRLITDETAGLDLGIINAAAYGVPPETMAVTGTIAQWSGQAYGIVGYEDGRAVTCTLSFVTDDMIYIAMVATLPGLHGRGYAEAAMRRAIAEAQDAVGERRLWLHATEMGRPVYKAMGFADGALLELYGFGA